ncbi:MAG: hypothetical protein R3290_08190 [Acidimicrobiia bacterium]|nr:hypothetical protein [Acidimicrobiia bacterium]
MGLHDTVATVYHRTAELLALDAHRPSALGPMLIGGQLDEFAVSVTGRSGGLLRAPYRNRFLVVAHPDRAATLPRGFRAERWVWHHRLRGWIPIPEEDPVAGVRADFRGQLAEWLTMERHAALLRGGSVPRFEASDGMFAAETPGAPETPDDLIGPLTDLVGVGRELTDA